MALSIPTSVGSKAKSLTTGGVTTSKSDVMVSRYDTSSSVLSMNSASSLLAGAAAAALNPANRHATRRAALMGGPGAPVVKSSVQTHVVSYIAVDEVG